MNKIRFFLTAFMLVNTSLTFSIDQLLSAIKSNNVKQVEELLKNETALTKEQKKQLLHEVQELISTYKSKSESIFRSETDLMRIGFGGTAAVLGLGWGLRGVFGTLWQGIQGKTTATLWSAAKACLGAGMVVGGAWQVYLGTLRSSALGNLHKAYEIEELVNAAVFKE